MKIRLTGQADEVKALSAMFLALRQSTNVKSVEVSRLYANRPPSQEFRTYIEIHLKDNSLGVLLPKGVK